MKTFTVVSGALVAAFVFGPLACSVERRVRIDEVDEDDDGYDLISNFSPSYRRRADILFVVDNSGSMSEEQGVLAEQVGIMIRELIDPEDPEALVIDDLHIGVVSSDMGTGSYMIQTCIDEEGVTGGDDGLLQNVGRPSGCDEVYNAADCDDRSCPWLSHSPDHPDDGRDPSNPPIWVDFGCIETLGTGGCGFEQPLEASYRALVEQTRPGMPNEGFLRDDAILAVIYVTDEDDCSTPNDEFFNPSRDDFGSLNVRCALNPDELYPISRYHDAFVELVGGDHSVVVGAIAGVPIDGSWDPGDSLDRLRDLQQVNPSNPNELLKSCDTAMGAAYPPTRIAELVYSFENNGMLASICRSDWTTTLLQLTRSIWGWGSFPTCIDDRVPEDVLEQCRVVETLDDDRPCPEPADLEGPDRTTGWHVDMGVVNGQRRCEILPADYDEDGCPDGSSACEGREQPDGLQGWYIVPFPVSRDCGEELRLTSTMIWGDFSEFSLECRRGS